MPLVAAALSIDAFINEPKEDAMTRFLLAAFLFAHGWIHAAIYALPQKPEETPPFQASHSWALSAAHVPEVSTRRVSIAMSWLTCAAFGTAAVFLVAGSDLWMSVTIASAALGLVLKALYFNPWLSLGVLIDVGLIALTTTSWASGLA
jgi:hypothetical protein